MTKLRGNQRLKGHSLSNPKIKINLIDPSMTIKEIMIGGKKLDQTLSETMKKILMKLSKKSSKINKKNKNRTLMLAFIAWNA